MTDTATVEEAPEAPAKRRGPKLCETCGEKRQVGGDESTMGKAVTQCVACIAETIKNGKCPICGMSTKTKTHQNKCVTTEAD